MAAAPNAAKAKEYSYLWEGNDKPGKLVKGEMRAPGEATTSNSLTVAMQNTEVLQSMTLQMVAIGGEAGSLDAMLSKVAVFMRPK